MMKGKKDSYMGDVGIIKKLDDIPELKERLIAAFDAKSHDHKAISHYSTALGNHILALTGIPRDDAIEQCFLINEKWRQGEVKFQAARNVAGVLLDLARTEKDPVKEKTLRVLAQVANTPHVKRHALIASDYAVKLINIMHPQNLDEVRKERETQIALMQSIQAVPLVPAAPRSSPDLLANLDQVHTTALGVGRIQKNLGLDAVDVVDWCKQKIKEAHDITRKGKNFYVHVNDIIITINAYSYTIITAHPIRRTKASQ